MKRRLADFNADIIDKVSLFNTSKEAVEHIEQHLRKDTPYIVSFINAHAYNLTLENTSFYAALLYSDIVLRDGAGMSILYKSLHRNPGANLNGTDFIPFCLQQWPKRKIALLGTTGPYLEAAKVKLQSTGCTVVLTENGFLPVAEYLPLIKASGAELIVLGMGMPKQEELSVFLKKNLSKNIIIFNGGAIIDFWGGRFKRAPIFIQNLQLEWLYRLLLEPRRLFIRYVKGNYVFLRRVPLIRKAFLANETEKISPQA